MNPETDFSRYEIGGGDDEEPSKSAGLTFCLKEFRSVLAFADAFNLPISASFDSGGLYVLYICVLGLLVFRIDFHFKAMILMTLHAVVENKENREPC